MCSAFAYFLRFCIAVVTVERCFYYLFGAACFPIFLQVAVPSDDSGSGLSDISDVEGLERFIDHFGADLALGGAADDQVVVIVF